MIAKAREKKISDETAVAEICDFLTSTAHKIDLFLAADVVVYFGDLSPLFQSIAKVAKDRAMFVFSTEKNDGNGFVRRDTGRYAHGSAEVIHGSSRSGFSVIANEDAVIPKQDGKSITGQIFILRYGSR